MPTSSTEEFPEMMIFYTETHNLIQIRKGVAKVLGANIEILQNNLSDFL